MTGFDAHLVVHVNEAEWERALEAVRDARSLLENNGYLVTQLPTLPHLQAPYAEVRRQMEGE